MAELLPGEEVVEGQDVNQVDRVRVVVADTYTFVRSQEINRTIAGFTFDHYIDEAKRQIKGTGRELRTASGEVAGIRPTKLELLEALETEFNASLDVAEALAKSAVQRNEEQSELDTNEDES